MKTLLRKLGAWVTVVVLLVGACLLPYFSQGVLAVTAGDATVYMDNATKVQEVTNTFKKCLNLKYATSTAAFHFGDIISGDLFADGGINQSNTDISTGAWLEKTVQGKVGDGAIWCKNDQSNIVNVFASTIGVSSWENLVCNGDKPGMMTLQVNKLVNPEKDIYAWQNTDTACDIGFGSSDYNFAWRSKDEAVAYIKSLYENYKTANPEVAKYLPAWDDLGNFSDKRVAYFSYLNDFKTACTDGQVYTGDPNLMNEVNYFPPIKEVNPGTGVLENVIYKRSITKENWKNSIVGSSGAHTCDTTITKINEYADAVAQEAEAIVAEAIKEAEEMAKERAKLGCKAQALYATVEFDDEGNVTNKIGFGEEPSAAYYYLKAKTFIDDPDAVREEIVNQLRTSLAESDSSLGDSEIDDLIAEQGAEIDEASKALVEKAQKVYDSFYKVLMGAGATTGDGNKETSYWYEGSDGSVVCTEFETFDGMIVNDSGYQDILNVLLGIATEPDSPTSVDPDSGDSGVCMDGAGSLGWILCPVIEMMSNTVQNIYDDYIQQNFMEVKAEWLDTSSDLYKEGWVKFRNYANIIFAILLLIVIFSQVTGIGITNYGIKKMLPRLVIVAVMINLSFFICQLAVDVSNIAGYTMKDILTKMGASFTGNSGNVGGIGLLNTLSIAGLGIGALSIGQWIVPLLVALLTALVSVAFAGLILGIRQAGVLILVVISPLAFACYALDGTKNLFDKWKKLFINLLIVFPACGLLMGGGIFASSLLASAASAGIFLKIIAALLKVVPFFFIPTLVKGALAAFGNIGAKISSFGRGISGNASRAMRGSDLYQRADAGAGALHGRGMLGLRKGIGGIIRKVPGGNKLADSKFGQFVGRRGNRRIARYAQKQYDLATKDAAANAIAGSGFMNAARRAGIEAAAQEKAEAQGIEEQQSLYRTQLGTAGVANETILTQELNRIKGELDDRPFDVTLRRKVKALSKFLLDFDNGRGALFKAMHEYMSQDPDKATAQAMNDFMQRGENMGIVKQTGQRGFQAMLQDIAQGKAKALKSFHEYAAAKGDKLNRSSLGGRDISAYDAEVESAGVGVMDDATLLDRLKIYDGALANPTTAGNIANEVRDRMNALYAIAKEKRPNIDLSGIKALNGQTTSINVPH